MPDFDPNSTNAAGDDAAGLLRPASQTPTSAFLMPSANSGADSVAHSDAHSDANSDAKTSPTMMQATRGGQLACVALILCVAVLLATLQWIALPMLRDLLTDNPATPPTSANVQLLRGLFLGAGAFGLLVAALLAQHAWAIYRSGQTPPNARWLWRDTFIVRGPRARRIAQLSAGAALLVALLCGGLTAFILDAVNQLAPLAVRPGVTIIDQTHPRL